LVAKLRQLGKIEALSRSKLVVLVKDIAPDAAVSRLHKATLVTKLRQFHMAQPQAAAEFGDGQLQNFLPLSKDVLAARVQHFMPGLLVSGQDKIALSQNLLDYHKEHPRAVVQRRAPNISEEDNQQLVSLLEGMSWHKYGKKKKKKSTVSQSRCVIRRCKAAYRRASRAAASGSQNFVLGVTRGALGSKGFERPGGQSWGCGKSGLGKNEAIVKKKAEVRPTSVRGFMVHPEEDGQRPRSRLQVHVHPG